MVRDWPLQLPHPLLPRLCRRAAFEHARHLATGRVSENAADYRNVPDNCGSDMRCGSNRAPSHKIVTLHGCSRIGAGHVENVPG